MDEHCTTAMLKVAIKYVKCIANMSFSIIQNLDAEVPRLVLLLCDRQHWHWHSRRRMGGVLASTIVESRESITVLQCVSGTARE